VLPEMHYYVLGEFKKKKLLKEKFLARKMSAKRMVENEKCGDVGNFVLGSEKKRKGKQTKKQHI
jgi:hypothetical protein